MHTFLKNILIILEVFIIYILLNLEITVHLSLLFSRNELSDTCHDVYNWDIIDMLLRQNILNPYITRLFHEQATIMYNYNNSY